jgi:hypothetical protein
MARPACAEVSVLIITPADDAQDFTIYESRLRSELSAAGFSVFAARVPGQPEYASIASNAERNASQAAIAVSVTEGELCGLLWISDPAHATDLMRPVRCCPLNNDAPLVFAVRATDALSAGLLELRYPRTERHAAEPATNDTPAMLAKPAEPPKKVEPSVTVTPKPETLAKKPEQPLATGANRTDWHIQVDGAAAVWLSDFPASLGAKFEFTRDFGSSWSAGIQTFGFGPATETREAGAATIYQFLAGVVARYESQLSQRLSMVEGVGAGLYGISISASATGPRRAQDAFATTGYVLFEHQVLFRASHSLSLALGGALSAPWAKYSVDFVDRTVARAAAPLLIGSLGLQLNL